MKKLDNKGFAITTIVYGISIMAIMIVAILMAIMSTTNTNNKKFAKEIERELNNFSKAESSFVDKGTGENNDYYPTPQEYTVPDGETGWYRIELWGTQGGGAAGGYGAYTSGIIKLNEGDTLYFYVGKHQEGTSSGRETDVRIQSGNYNDSTSLLTRIMVAAGGGSASAPGGTLKGYTTGMTAQGGSLKSAGDGSDYSLFNDGTNGSLVGYLPTYETDKLLAVDQLPPEQVVTNLVVTNNNGGGDGYVPSSSPNVGGVSFIAGYAGNYAYFSNATGTKVSKNSKVHYKNQITEEERDYYFIDSRMIAGVNKGDGRAKIERIIATEESSNVLKQNEKFINVRIIRDCNDSGQATKISAIKDGEDIAINKTLVDAGACKQVDLGSPTSLSEIATWHTDGIDLKNHTIAICKKSTCAEGEWKYIKGKSSETEYSETETVSGIHISAYQPDFTTTIPKKGTYYVFPVLYENKIMTAQSNPESESTPIKAEVLEGTKSQKWSIEEIPARTNPKKKADGTFVAETEYKIVELGQYKSLNIAADQNRVTNEIAASQAFNNYARNEPQIWKIKSLGNGTYTISTVVEPADEDIPSGNILPLPFPINQNIAENYQNSFIIGKNNTDTQRFKLISLEYSNE